MISVVVHSYGSDRLESVQEYLTRDARHLAVETSRGQTIQTAMEQMQEPPHNDRSLAFTQLAISLADGESATPDELFSAGRDILEAMNLRRRPFIAVMHGPPNDDRTHLHIIVPLRDPATGEPPLVARLPRDAREAAKVVAPLYGWHTPGDGHEVRRREPRAARSLGVWHGERSLHGWIATVVAPTVLPRIERATRPEEIVAALGEYGLRYVFTERGAVIEDHSSDPVRKVAASALGYTAGGAAIGKRFGREWSSPIPLDAKTNPRAYANDREGRELPIATEEERRAFAAEHATWQAVWRPIRDERLREQRGREQARTDARRAAIAQMRAARDETATSREERALANEVIRRSADAARERDVALGKAERAALRTLPFATAPPGRLREWLATRVPKDNDPRILVAPGTHADTLPVDEVEDVTIVAGMTPATNEWWTGNRRVAIDYGKQIVVADIGVLPIAMTEAHRRWGHQMIGGDPLFRDSAERIARAGGLSYGFRAPQIATAIEPFMVTEPQPAIRAATAVARHLGVTSLELDGARFDPAAPQLHPRAREASGTPGPEPTIAVDPDALAFRADAGELASLAQHDIHPTLVAGDVAFFAVAQATPRADRDRLRSILAETFGVAPVRSASLGGPLRYLDPQPSIGMTRLLEAIRPPAPAVTYEQRINAIDRFVRGLMPRPEDPPMKRAPIVIVEEQPRARKRGTRKR